MNKEQLRKTLKPLIKECIKEVIFEEGVLSGIISEVMKSTSNQRIVETQTQPTYQKPQVDHKAQHRKLNEQRKKMLNSIGRESSNGVDAGAGSMQGSRALEGVSPSDPGVDLSSFGASAALWSKLAKGK